MTYPTIAEVEAADKLQLAKWYRYLPSANAEDKKSVVILSRIIERFKAEGFWTPELSKQVGWDGEPETYG